MPVPPPPTPSWDCVAGICVDPGTGLGFYPTLAACLAACSPPIPPPPPPFTAGCEPVNVVRARHTDFTLTSPPLAIVTILNDGACADLLPNPIAARQIGFTPSGLPWLAYAWECCDPTCTDAEILAGDCYKKPDCWPLGPGPGITKRLALYLFDVDTCWSARRQNCPVAAYLIYDDGDGKWHGDVVLRGGTLHITFACNDGVDPIDPGKFTISWSGCDTGSVSVGYNCSDPLLVNSGNISIVQKCCDCNQDGGLGPITDVTATINMFVVGNCRRQVMARHIDFVYKPPGTDDPVGHYYPLVANTKPCVWHQNDCYTCANMQCPLVAEISTDDAACDIMTGTFGMSYDSGEGVWANGRFTTFTLTCTDLGDGRPDPDTPDCISCSHIGLHLSIVCGTDNVFTFGDITIPACDLENLDVTFTGSGTSVEDPPPCCTGTISVRIMRA